MKWVCLLYAALALLSPVEAIAAGSIDDCEKIKAAAAYNLCLASFGPKRGGGRAAAAPVIPENSVPPGQRHSGARAVPVARHHLRVNHPHTVFGGPRRRGGRLSLQFDIVRRK